MTFTHDTARKGMKMFYLDAPQGYESLNKLYCGKRVFLVLPPFHVRTIPRLQSFHTRATWMKLTYCRVRA